MMGKLRGEGDGLIGERWGRTGKAALGFGPVFECGCGEGCRGRSKLTCLLVVFGALKGNCVMAARGLDVGLPCGFW